MKMISFGKKSKVVYFGKKEYKMKMIYFCKKYQMKKISFGKM